MSTRANRMGVDGKRRKSCSTCGSRSGLLTFPWFPGVPQNFL